MGVVESHSLMPGSVLGFLPYKSGLMYLMAYDAAKLLLDAHNLHARSASAYEIADVAVRRNHARLTVIRGALRRQAQYHTARQLQVIVRQKLNADRLPCDSAARIYGASGVGGICDVCDKLLSPTQLVMSVPWPRQQTFAHLHADCFIAWRAMISSIAARRHTA